MPKSKRLVSKIIGKDVNDVQSLLEQLVKAEDALSMLGKPSFYAVIFINDPDNNDSYEVGLNYNIAKACLVSQIERINSDLAKLGLAIDGKIP